MRGNWRVICGWSTTVFPSGGGQGGGGPRATRPLRCARLHLGEEAQAGRPQGDICRRLPATCSPGPAAAPARPPISVARKGPWDRDLSRALRTPPATVAGSGVGASPPDVGSVFLGLGRHSLSSDGFALGCCYSRCGREGVPGSPHSETCILTRGQGCARVPRTLPGAGTYR